MFNNNSMNYYSTSTLKSALLKSYAWMAIALSITAIVSYGLYATNALLILLSTMTFIPVLDVDLAIETPKAMDKINGAITNNKIGRAHV